MSFLPFLTFPCHSSGAYSVVYLGVEKSSGKEWAVKVVDKKNTSSKSMLQEIDVMAKLSHPHVVNFKEIFDTSKGYYVVME
jgi:serine/threonine protein kinase